MKSYIIFSAREPILIVTRGTIHNKNVIDHLRKIGCSKFISREVSLDHVRRQYGRRFEVTAGAIDDGHLLRVLDSSGRRVFENLPFSEIGRAHRYEADAAQA
jgi:hypothetical protein